MQKSLIKQFLKKKLKDLKDSLSEHIKEYGDDSIVLYPLKGPLHPQKYTRYYLNNEISKVENALEELKEDDCFFQGTVSLNLIVGGESLDFHAVCPTDLIFVPPSLELPTKEGLDLLNKIANSSYKFSNNSSVRLIGPPNGVCEERGKIGDIGIITDVTAYLTKDYFAGTPEGYSYMVKSPSFVGAVCNELWVHESNLELANDF